MILKMQVNGSNYLWQNLYIDRCEAISLNSHAQERQAQESNQLPNYVKMR